MVFLGDNTVWVIQHANDLTVLDAQQRHSVQMNFASLIVMGTVKSVKTRSPLESSENHPRRAATARASPELENDEKRTV